MYSRLIINTDEYNNITSVEYYDNDGNEKFMLLKFIDELYLNDKKVKSLKAVDDRKIDIERTVKRFKERPNIPNALQTYKHSINDLKNRPISFITSCFFLWYLDYFGEKPNSECDKIVEPHFELFRDEHKEFKPKSNSKEENERCYDFIKYVKNRLSDDEWCELRILCELINFIRNAYLDKIENVVNTFFNYVFKPTIDNKIIELMDGKVNKYYDYGYAMYLLKCISDCKDILPIDIIIKMDSNAIWLLFHYDNRDNISISYKNVEKYIELNLKKLSDQLKLLTKWGFKPPKHRNICDNTDSIISVYEQIKNERHVYPMQLDGMVIKVDEIEKQNQMGYTSKYPRYACAYKFPAVEGTSIVKDVAFYIGRTGVVTPVALIEPVKLDGAVVTRVTLHNVGEIERLGLMKNDYVAVIRSGDVIPKIINVFKDRRDGTQTKIDIPTRCYICGTSLTLNGSILSCQNISCNARKEARINHFVSKDGMNIKGLGSSLIKQLVNKNMVNKFSDLYNLTIDDLTKLDLVQKKTAMNIINAIQKTKRCELWRFISALGIEHVGGSAAKKLVDKFGKNIFNVNWLNLMDVSGIGHETAYSIHLFYTFNRSEIDYLFDILQPVNNTNEVVKNDAIDGRIFVITGTLSKPRSEIAKSIFHGGGIIANSVTNKTDYLIVGKNPGSKLEEANNRRIKVITEEEFESLLK